MIYELKLSSGKVVTWEGKSGEDAAHRYVDCHRESTVIAWRHPKGPRIVTHFAERADRIRILEPGDPG